jgi:hypothetical protein
VSGVDPGAAGAWPWVALLLLGALHGLNPGMGWLFAVALGVQQGARRAVWRAVLALTVGHALAVAAAVAATLGLGLVVPTHLIRWLVAAALAALGLRQLRRHRHPRFGGMRMGVRDLVAWSFLVATAHGAGLMAAPFALQAQGHGGHARAAHPAAHMAAHMAAVATVDGPTLAATLVHTAGYVLVTALLAFVVYERAGLGVLRRAWVNLDVVWAATLVLTAGAVALL